MIYLWYSVYNETSNREERKLKPRSPKSLELYDILIARGYSERFSYEVTCNLNTDWTAQRMIGYLSYYKKLPEEEIADEVLAILSDRARIMKKKELEEVNGKWNQFLWQGFDSDEDM